MQAQLKFNGMPRLIDAGANFYIVGHDPAGMGHSTEKRDLYDPDLGRGC